MLRELIIRGQQHLGVVLGALVYCSVWEPRAHRTFLPITGEPAA